MVRSKTFRSKMFRSNYLTATAAAAALSPRIASIECDFRYCKLDSIAAFFIDSIAAFFIERQDSIDEFFIDSIESIDSIAAFFIESIERRDSIEEFFIDSIESIDSIEECFIDSDFGNSVDELLWPPLDDEADKLSADSCDDIVYQKFWKSLSRYFRSNSFNSYSVQNVSKLIVYQQVFFSTKNEGVFWSTN